MLGRRKRFPEATASRHGGGRAGGAQGWALGLHCTAGARQAPLSRAPLAGGPGPRALGPMGFLGHEPRVSGATQAKALSLTCLLQEYKVSRALRPNASAFLIMVFAL